MGRTKGAKNFKSKSARRQFNDLDILRKVICYNYWIYIKSDKKEGWDISRAGSVKHWGQSEYISDNIAKTSFYHLGKVSMSNANNLVLNRRLTIHLNSVWLK